MINSQTVERLNSIQDRFIKINDQLASQDHNADIGAMTELNKELSKIASVVELYKQYQNTSEELSQTQQLLDSKDEEMRQLVELEIENLEKKLVDLENQIKIELVPKDPLADRNIFLEIRAGTGGNEAALFAGDLFNMYARYAEKNRFTLDIINVSESEYGGYKEVVVKLNGKMVYAKLKFESGTHRVQRVPQTETQGRLHTSACTVAILPEIEKTESVEIDPKDLRIDTFRASGAGGQHVNKTDSAVRITHLPTSLVVECQEGRSQHQNKAQAMQLLNSKILEQKRQQEESELAKQRKSQVGSGDRSERIRTYNFPQGRLTDHRINLSLYNLTDLLAGNLEELISALQEDENIRNLAGLE